MCLDGDKLSTLTNKFAEVMGVGAMVVVRVPLVSVVVEVLFAVNGFLSLLSILSLPLFPNNLFHGIFPRMILEVDVVVVVVGTLVVGSSSGATANVMYSLEVSDLDSALLNVAFEVM